jgi:WD40 repeat protein/serine/threonine protein kinase
MSAGATCRECGTAIPAESLGGFCAQCLLRLGLENAHPPADARAIDPKPAEEEPGSGESGRASSKQNANSIRASVPLTEKPGDWIGRYRLLQEIGHGGCGVVYLAEQEEPVRRKVALKVIKLGMDTRQVVARFEVERQALALMDHPNIAKVLDAGATNTGRPYFVMELVGGIKITDYCEQNHLTTRQRLDLFIQVCRAIQHAHQKGIIHRDIKPSNVLVATPDDVPVPKVIDFGIAKATQGRLTDQTVFTAFEQFLGTPAYMSPEQAQVGGLDVDTRSDIYSLGVLLYELLAGKTPFDTKELLAAGLDAMRRTIQEKEPPTPSTRLAHERAVASSKSEIVNRKSEIDRELDWIVMKCLEKDRARRYETANGLASDLKRHLNNEPVLARPPSKLYEFHKNLRRHKVGFAATGAIIAALILGLVGSFSQWRRAEEHATLERSARNRAVQAIERAQDALSQMQAIEVRRAEEYYQSGDRQNMLPYLALVLRQNPSNRIAAERLFSTLSHRNWARLACPPLVHSNRVTACMFSRDGRLVVTASADKTAWVWDPDTGKRVSGPLIHNGEINDAEFSPDCQLVVTASDDHTARVWDARTGRPVCEPVPHPERIVLARFSPDSQTFVTLCDDRSIRLFDAHSGQSLLKPLRHGVGPPEWGFFRETAFSPDGALLVAASKEERVLRVWSLRTGAMVNLLVHPWREVARVRFSPDGRRLAAAFDTNSAAIWDLTTKPPQVVWISTQASIQSAEFSPEGQRVVTASTDGTARVWDAITGKPAGPSLHHANAVASALFSPEGLQVVTASLDETVRIWDAETGEALAEPINVENAAFYGQFHPDGQRVLSASNGKTVLVWWVCGSVSLSLHDRFQPTCVEFSSDNARVVVGTEQGQVQIWESVTGRGPTVLSGHSDSVRCAAFSADGKHVATGSRDGTARVWAVVSGQPVAKPFVMGVRRTDVFLVQFSPDSRRVMAASYSGAARLWDAVTGEPASPPMGDGVIAAQLSPNGRWIATGETNGTVRIWDCATGRPVSAILRHEGPILSVCFSPDSKRLLAGSADALLGMWSVSSGEPLAAPMLHGIGLNCVRFSPEGREFLTVVQDHPSVRVWDAATAKLLTEVPTGDVAEAEFSPDGQRIMTVSPWPRALQLWDARTGERLSEPLSQEVKAHVRISPDGRFIAAVARRGPVQFWEITSSLLPVPSWLPELAEALAGRRFTQQGLLEPVSPTVLWAVQEKMASWVAVNKLQPDAPWVHWAKWFVALPNSRTILPSSGLTLARYAEASAKNHVSLAAAKEALLLQPTNLIATRAFAEMTTNVVMVSDQSTLTKTSGWRRTTVQSPSVHP